MNFCSTRDVRLRSPLSRALQDGIAPDGGLFVPVQIPELDPRSLPRHVTLAEMTPQLLAPYFAGDALMPELSAIAAEAFDFPVPLTARQERCRTALGSGAISWTDGRIQGLRGPFPRGMPRAHASTGLAAAVRARRHLGRHRQRRGSRFSPPPRISRCDTFPGRPGVAIAGTATDLLGRQCPQLRRSWQLR